MLVLSNEGDASNFVERQQELGSDVRWDGWEIVFYSADPRAMYSPLGAFRNGRWGFENRVPLNDDGTWSVDYRNVKRAKATVRAA